MPTSQWTGRFAIVLAVLGIVLGGAYAAHASTLSLTPSSGSFVQGQTITVSVMLDTQGAAIDGVDIRYLHYDPALLSVQDDDAATAGVQIMDAHVMPMTKVNTVNTSTGQISFSQIVNTGTTFTSTSTRTLATIHFTALAGGTANVAFDFTPGGTTDANVASNGSESLTGVTNASFTLTAADTTAPVITLGPTTSSITSSGASITWTTDEQSTSQVEYGTTISYGTLTPLDSTLVTSHSVSLSSLSPNTTYHYRVRSKDAAGNEVVSSDIVFTTPPPPDTTAPVRSMGSPSGVLPTGTQTTTLSLTTDENATCKYSTTAGTSYDAMPNTFGTTGGTSHTQSLTGLANGQSYSYSVRCADTAGNKNPDDYTIAFSVANPSPDTTAPSVPGSASLTPASQSQINLSWTGSTDPSVSGQVTSGLAGYRIYRCQGTGCSPTTALASPTGTTYQDTSLTPNTTYGYGITSFDNAGNESTKSTTSYATTPADTTAPTISGVNVINIKANGGTITWNTNESSDSKVMYGTSASNLNLTASNATLTTGHAVPLTGLLKKTIYYFRVSSNDASGNTATSPTPPATNSFKTNPGGGVLSLQASNGSIRLKWAPITDPDIASIVILRSTTGYPDTTAVPLVTLPATATNYRDTAVTPGTTYYYTVVTKTAGGEMNEASHVSYVAPAEHGGGAGPVMGQTGQTMSSRLTATLMVGSKNGDVMTLQTFLMSQGLLASGNNTGTFGPLTLAAVKQFQCDQNIVCTGNQTSTGWGKVGIRTRQRINEMLGVMIPSSVPKGVGSDLSSLSADQTTQLIGVVATLQTVQQTLNDYKANPNATNGSSTLAFIANTLNHLQMLLGQIVGGR